MPKDHGRVVLVDTFKDEVEEALRIADELGKDLYGIRVDTPSERGGVTAGLFVKCERNWTSLVMTM